jgi:hypothetical protein
LSNPYAEFDAWCERRGIAPEDAPEAFGQWLADKSGNAIIGGPVGEAPEIVAIPDEEAPDA